MIDVIKELSLIAKYFESREYKIALDKLDILWEMVPEPKNKIPNAYLIIEYAVAFAFKSGDYERAHKWALFAPPFAEVRHDMGEVEFLMGKVAYERGEYENAKNYFLISHKKSEGRAFDGQEKKYINLIRT